MKSLDKYSWKFRNKLFTWEQMVKLCEEVVQAEKKIWVREQQLGMAYTIACALNAEPFRFGKKRLFTFFSLLFTQAKWLNREPEDAELVVDTVKKLKLKFKFEGDYITISEDTI